MPFKCTVSSQRRCCFFALHFFDGSSGLQPASALWFPSHGPVANQSLSFCLAVMHTNSQQHILISPESKAHQSQLTGLPGPARAILKKCFILPVRHMWIWADDFATYVWEFLLPPQHLCSRCNDISGGCCVMAAIIIFNHSKARFDLKIKQKMFPESLWYCYIISKCPTCPQESRVRFHLFIFLWQVICH